jgi:hypothetical protein
VSGDAACLWAPFALVIIPERWWFAIVAAWEAACLYATESAPVAWLALAFWIAASHMALIYWVSPERHS